MQHVALSRLIGNRTYAASGPIAARSISDPAQPEKASELALQERDARQPDTPGVRPFVVVQNDEGNRSSPITMAVPFFRRQAVKNLEINVPVDAEPGNGLRYDSVADCGHILTIELQQITRIIGGLSDETMAKIDMGLRRSLDLMT